jgi:DNA repair protein RecO (recombination protein O)
VGRTYKTEAVVLRSMRFAEADRILHLFTSERGRVNAIAKGVRRTGSRFGGRLEPLTHVALMLHEGRGELHTVSGADIVSSHAAVREHPYPLAVGQIGAEAVLKLQVEPEPQRPLFTGLNRFLTVLETWRPQVGTDPDPALDPVGLGFQLKLLMLSGYLPHLTACASCGADGPLAGYSPAAGGAVCQSCLGGEGTFALGPESLEAIEALLAQPLGGPELTGRSSRDALRVLERSYEYHGGFQLRTLHA